MGARCFGAPNPVALRIECLRIFGFLMTEGMKKAATSGAYVSASSLGARIDEALDRTGYFGP